MDAEIVGSGPNGLAAAVTLARAGLAVRVYEANDTAGGSARTLKSELTGALHDVGSAVHPMAVASPFFEAFELSTRIKLLYPPISFGHPLAEGRAGLAFPSMETTARALGAEGHAWRRMFSPLVQNIETVSRATGGSLFEMARTPLVGLQLGLRIAHMYASSVSSETSVVAAMLAGLSAHSIAPLPTIGGSAVGVVLGAHAHAKGWPIPQGGSQAIVDAMVRDLLDFGGSIELNRRIETLGELSAPIKILDVSARALELIAGDALPERYRRQLSRTKFGGAASKVDFVLSEPVPWSNVQLKDAGTVHIGGTWRDIARAERTIKKGHHSAAPYVLAAQPSLLDPTRAPGGQQVLWSYAHVPNGSTRDVTDVVSSQIERYAPGFRDTVIGSFSTSASKIGEMNANHVGGDIATGAVDIQQLLARPSLSAVPWRTPTKGIYICSAGSAPGPGVHGMSGFNAARTALRDVHGILEPPFLGSTHTFRRD